MWYLVLQVENEEQEKFVTYKLLVTGYALNHNITQNPSAILNI